MTNANVTVPAKELAKIRRTISGQKAAAALVTYLALCELAAEGRAGTRDDVSERSPASNGTTTRYLGELAELGVVSIEKRGRGPWRYAPTASAARGGQQLLGR